MKFLIRIEEIINALIYKMADYISRLIPSFVISFIHQIKKIPHQILVLFILLALKLKEFISHYLHLVINSVKKIKEIPNKKQALINFILFPLHSFKTSPITTSISLIAILASSGAFVTILSNFKKIKSELAVAHPVAPILKHNRELSSTHVTHHEEKEADYQEEIKNQIKLEAVELQVFLENTHKNHQVWIDITLKSSSTEVTKFIKHNEERIRDRIATKFEPIVPIVPIENIGRQVIKDKLKEEINLLIKEENIPGKIEEVYIDSAISS